MDQQIDDRARGLATTLREVFRHQGARLPAKLLQSGRAELLETNFDNWNGGTFTYSFVLRVPVDLFAQLGDQQSAVEKLIEERLHGLFRTETNEHVSEVVIMPDVSLSPSTIPSSDEDSRGIWQDGSFRVFLSHVSRIKVQTHALKMFLSKFGIAGFVAHDDIQPTRDWQSVIEGALRTMDVLVALVTSDFVESRWCDQEVGIAIGRDRLVIPVRLGADPYGFMGRYQGVPGQGLKPSELAGRLVTILINHERMSRRFAEAVLNEFAEAKDFDRARNLVKTLERFDAIPSELLRRAATALESSNELKSAPTVPERFKKLLAKHGVR